MVEDNQIPRIVLATAATEGDNVLLYPEQLADFLKAHWDWIWVGQNWAFDYWVVHQYLTQRLGHHALVVWKGLVHSGRVLDTMLLDQLYQLSLLEEDTDFRRRNLGVLAEEYAGLQIDKEDPYRKRYGELLGKEWIFRDVEEGFLEYAMKDSIATLLVAEVLYDKVRERQYSFLPDRTQARADVYHHADKRFGPLSHDIQLKASIALSQSSRDGMLVDQDRVRAAEAETRTKIEDLVAKMVEVDPEIFDRYVAKRYKGAPKLTPNGIPKLRQLRLREILSQVAQERGLSIPKTAKSGLISISADDWAGHKDAHPIIEGWLELTEAAKTLQFLANLSRWEEVHPNYETLVRTGRTSSYAGKRKGGINIQQMPREAWFREFFVARPGFEFIVADYSFIELRTLASVCKARYGYSTLADVIAQGTDPHAYTAALCVGMGLEDFLALKQTDPETFKHHRQAAKAVNFGVPGGLGIAKLVTYARLNYGIEMTQQQASQLKAKLINEVYPELARYLADDSLKDLARNLGKPEGLVRQEFGVDEDNASIKGASLRKIVAGRAFKADGTPYSPYYVDQCWDGLANLAGNLSPAEKQQIAQRQGSPELESKLFRRTVATLTGRLRSGVTYTSARNTPFQGLAADGAKLALWSMVSDGLRVVAFVHDEVVVEVPLGTPHCEVTNRLNEAMEEVLFPGVRSEVEFKRSIKWEKP